MNSMSLKRNSRFDIMVAAVKAALPTGKGASPAARYRNVVCRTRRGPSRDAASMELLTALVMGQPSLACDVCVVSAGCPEPRPPPQSVVVTGNDCQSANRRRVLPHDDVKQAGPRRLASSSSTALGVTIRVGSPGVLACKSH